MCEVPNSMNRVEDPEPPRGNGSELSGLVVREYSQGICHDGAAILCEGQPMTPDEIVARLRTMEEALIGFKRQYRFSPWIHKQVDDALDA